MFELEFSRNQVDCPRLCGRERAREGEFVAEGVGREEEDARVQCEGSGVGGTVVPAKELNQSSLSSVTSSAAVTGYHESLRPLVWRYRRVSPGLPRLDPP
jgi:hypothetical protein